MQPDLFTWTPPFRVLVFPMTKRVGRIREVAARMLDKPTERSAAFYRNQVTDALRRQLDRAGIPEHEQDEELRQFWEAAQAEMLRTLYRGRRPGGDAA